MSSQRGVRSYPPIRLGAEGFSEPNPIFKADDRNTDKKSGSFLLVGVALTFIALGGAVAALGITGVISFTSDDSTSGSVAGDGLPTSSPVFQAQTLFPTPFVTPRPTTFPTNFPTFTPSTRPTTAAEATGSPSFTPSRAPTLSPVSACENPDAECGCNQVRSTLIDIIFMLDVSGSVDDDDYRTMKEAIKDYAEINMPQSTRIGYIEFNSVVRKEFDLSEFSDAQSLSQSLDQFDFTDGGTNQKSAFVAANAMLQTQSGAARDDASLALLMVTDGNPDPCDTGGFCECSFFSCDECCDAALADSGGANTLAQMVGDFELKFFFLPVNPDSGQDNVNTGLFDSAGLSDDVFQTFEIGNFEEFGELLQGEDLVIPLGPCVEAPTVSGGDRILEWEALQEGSKEIEGFFGV